MTNESLRRVVTNALQVAERNLDDLNTSIASRQLELAEFIRIRGNRETEVTELNEALDAIKADEVTDGTITKE